MPDPKEAQRLWNQMLALEQEKPGEEEDKEAFFMNKEKEMKKLRDAYAKASGLDPDNVQANDAIQRRQTMDAILGVRRDTPITRKDLE